MGGPPGTRASVLDRKGRLVAELVAGRPGLHDVAVGELASQPMAKARLVEPAAFAAAAEEARRELPADRGDCRPRSRYEDESAGGEVDFDDLLGRYTAPSKATAVSPPRSGGDAHVFVDELHPFSPVCCWPCSGKTTTSSSWVTPTRPSMGGTGQTPSSWPVPPLARCGGRPPRRQPPVHPSGSGGRQFGPRPASDACAR